ncbi:hypothetical protein PG996_006417 [Apiospora saccharicola]|uniref:Uncharacterized protein n=1 Tax=Apiospora saccharicola TaxID=335842 RepID=A0ABR1VT65_9PEZI
MAGPDIYWYHPYIFAWFIFCHNYIRPLLPEGPLCWHLVFVLVEKVVSKAAQICGGIWLVVRYVIPKPEPMEVTPDLRQLQSSMLEFEHRAAIAETISGWLGLPSLGIWAICYVGRSYTESPAVKKERLEEEKKKKRDEEAAQ